MTRGPLGSTGPDLRPTGQGWVVSRSACVLYEFSKITFSPSNNTIILPAKTLKLCFPYLALKSTWNLFLCTL